MRTKLKSTTRVEKVPISIWKVSGLIADHLPEIGLADDAQLLARTLERNSLELNWFG
jgi:hypothetical protein